MTSISGRLVTKTELHRQRRNVSKLFFWTGMLMLLIFAILLLNGCQGPTDPSDSDGPDSVTQIVIVGPNNSGNGGSTTGPDAACAGITGTAALSAFSGTFSGGKGKVNEPLHLRVIGLTVPNTCNPVLDVTASGSCSRLGSFHSLNDIAVLPTSPGACTTTVCIAGTGKCAANTTDVIE